MWPYTSSSAYSQQIQEFWTPDDAYAEFDTSLPDDKLYKLIVQSLNEDIDFWNKAPWKLKDTDANNIDYFLGNQGEKNFLTGAANDEIDNRLFSSVRAILSYATGQLAQPELTPSRSDEFFLTQARNTQLALYQHSLDENVEVKVRSAVMNLLMRKRGFLKQRFDPDAGMYGDIVTEVVDPSDIIFDRYSRFLANPNKIYHRIRCTLDELCARFPNKANELYQAFGIKQGRFSQLSRYVTYYECWFTYLDGKGKPKEGVSHFMHDPSPLILDKLPNPNWVYTGDDQKDKQINVMTAAPKPFTSFNYLNLGMSAIDETCLFDQARPLQSLLNKRQKQWHDNIDYANGRWVASSRAMNEETATKIVNRGAKTIAMVDTDKTGNNVSNAFMNVAAQALPREVYESIVDLRNEIDTMMGTPSVFRGAQPERQDTLGRDMMVKQQAGMLQDDLVRAVQNGMQQYYQLKLQMMRVFYTEDYWFQVKGGDGKFDFIMLNGEGIDTNMKIGVQVDSTLPLDKPMLRSLASELLKMNKIDYLTAMEDLGVPNPEVRTERYFKSQLQPYVYMQSVEKGLVNNEAEMDIQLLIAGKEPEERDFTEDYLNYYNTYLTTTRYQKLGQEQPDAAQRVMSYLMLVQHQASQTANTQQAMLDAAGMLDQPPLYPPKVQVRLQGKVDDQAAASMASGQLPPTPQPQAAPAPASQPPAQ